MSIRRNIRISIFLLCAIFISGFLFFNKDIFSTKGTSFLNRKKIIQIVKTPRDIFKTHPIFFTENKNVIDFTENNNQFIWDLDENINGSLKFKLVILKNKNNSKTVLPKFCQFYLFLKNGKHKKFLIQKKFTFNQFKERRKYFILVKRFKILHNFKKGNSLVFKIEFPKSSNSKGVLFGVTIPKIQKLSLINNQNVYHPNLIIISIDTLRSDYLGLYKKLENEVFDFSFSPNLDEFSNKAVVFKNTYTPLSATWPALVSLFTSKYPCEHGVMYNRNQLQFYFDSIATHMLNLGYITLSLHGNAYGIKFPGIEEKYNFFNNDIDLIKYAVKILQRDCDFPFFHWYHLMGVHAAYVPPKWVMSIIEKDKPYRLYKLGNIMRGKVEVKPAEIEYIRKLYAGELYNLDFELNKIFNFLKINNLWEKTMVIVTSDHGEDLYQHNKNFFHYPSLYNSSLKIPLMIKFPFQDHQIIVEEQVSLLDLFPTIVDYFRDNKKKDTDRIDFSGISLLTLLNGEKDQFQKRIIFAGAKRFEIISALYKGWKLIYNPKGLIINNHVGLPYPYKKIELYKSNEDFFEENNVYKQNFKLVKELIKQINNFKVQYNNLKSNKTKYHIKTSKEFSRKALENLKTLGYIK